MLARSFERIPASDDLSAQVSRLSADTHHLLGAPIVRLEFVVGYSPILHGEVG